jgi:hypothetical protein
VSFGKKGGGTPARAGAQVTPAGDDAESFPKMLKLGMLGLIGLSAILAGFYAADRNAEIAARPAPPPKPVPAAQPAASGPTPYERCVARARLRHKASQRDAEQQCREHKGPLD